MAFGRLLGVPAMASGTPAVGATTPPTIYHVVTTPMCKRLHDTVRPAVAMILQNDQQIAKGGPLFKQYGRAVFGAQDTATGNFSNGAQPINDSIYNQSPATSMALQRMSYLVSPIAQNVLGAQKLLGEAELVKPTGNPSDDRKLALIKQRLLQAVADQSASLDLINGFVTTQQMGELQHAGEEYISQIQGKDSTATIVQRTPNPLLQDPNTPGLAPDPYAVDLAAVPGLSVGYNPLTRILGGFQWLQSETAKRESAAASSITAALKECNQ
jgi:hypothetical protein